MITVDARCKDSGCANSNIYRMVGKCSNCGADPVLVLFSVGHKAVTERCPTCGVDHTVRVSRLATPEEIPVG